MLTYNFHKNFQLPNRATRIWNLVALMKFLLAPGKRAAVNVEPCICSVYMDRQIRVDLCDEQLKGWVQERPLGFLAIFESVQK